MAGKSGMVTSMIGPPGMPDTSSKLVDSMEWEQLSKSTN